MEEPHRVVEVVGVATEQRHDARHPGRVVATPPGGHVTVSAGPFVADLQALETTVRGCPELATVVEVLGEQEGRVGHRRDRTRRAQVSTVTRRGITLPPRPTISLPRKVLMLATILRTVGSAAFGLADNAEQISRRMRTTAARMATTSRQR